MSVTVSAPGKLMLYGEHAVVYGKACIVTAVNQRMRLSIKSINRNLLEIISSDVGLVGYKKALSDIGSGYIPKGARFVEKAVRVFFYRYNLKGGIRIQTLSTFSSQYGFGSSAASVVCTLKGLSTLYDISITKKDLFDLSLDVVLGVQGKGSGFDVAAALYGGTLYFKTNGSIIEPLEIESLPLVVGYSGEKADTTVLIERVLSLKSKYQNIVESIFDQIDVLVQQAKGALNEHNWHKLGDLMNINHGYLESLGVANQKLSVMIYASREAGSYGAKLSGAGGGDCMIAICPPSKRNKVVKAISDVKGEVIAVRTGAEGVFVEENKTDLSL